MSKQTKIEEVVRHIRCNMGHSGNTTLSHSQGDYWECAGCGAWHSEKSIRQTFAGPVTGITGSGGLVHVANR